MSDVILFWVPFYYSFKLGFLIWMMLPGQKGATFIYQAVRSRVIAADRSTCQRVQLQCLKVFVGKKIKSPRIVCNLVKGKRDCIAHHHSNCQWRSQVLCATKCLCFIEGWSKCLRKTDSKVPGRESCLVSSICAKLQQVAEGVRHWSFILEDLVSVKRCFNFAWTHWIWTGFCP